MSPRLVLLVRREVLPSSRPAGFVVSVNSVNEVRRRRVTYASSRR